MSGWVKLHRKLRHSAVWNSEEPFTRGQAWVDLLMAANFKPRTVFVRGVPVRLERGQVGESTVTLAEKWQRSRGWVTRFLQWLESEQQIVQQKNNVTSIISIINFEQYQQHGTADDTASDTADGQQTVQQTDTTKKEEKGKKDEKGGTPPTPPRENGQPKKFTAEDLERLKWPPTLDTEIGRAALSEWVDHKRSVGQGYKTTAGPQKILNEFEPIGDHGLAASINHSIACNYAGVFVRHANSPAVITEKLISLAELDGPE